jgi:hypothetical protein
MSFNPVTVDRFDPPFVNALWPLAWLSIIIAATALPFLIRRSRGLASDDPSVSVIHLVVLSLVLVCGALTLVHHVRVTEPQVQGYLRDHPSATFLRAATNRDYRSDGLAWALATASLLVSIHVRSHARKKVGGA